MHKQYSLKNKKMYIHFAYILW